MTHRRNRRAAHIGTVKTDDIDVPGSRIPPNASCGPHFFRKTTVHSVQGITPEPGESDFPDLNRLQGRQMITEFRFLRHIHLESMRGQRSPAALPDAQLVVDNQNAHRSVHCDTYLWRIEIRNQGLDQRMSGQGIGLA